MAKAISVRLDDDSQPSYGNTSEYLRELIRRDQHDQAAHRLRDLIADGLVSGESTCVVSSL